MMDGYHLSKHPFAKRLNRKFTYKNMLLLIRTLRELLRHRVQTLRRAKLLERRENETKLKKK